VFAVGDRRRYMTALIVPDLNIIQGHLGLPERPLLQDSKIRDFMQGEVKRSMEELADFERIKRFLLLEEPFTVENGLMTPTLKLRRKQITQRYEQEVERLYQEGAPDPIHV
jgi:long-chain acyl-CoA synthetase